ncbi:hypothetical protein KGF54_002496 [Candida jiufengensis]|uniref:uncharacterized protein n=1 Tax=Candida jiufengensis TaxID=497108 RepID=UPI0022250F80|nr:uncharacterized protein KGF54_002496 [Candida jiufengensis]KAI5953125.1 hypothetical protein KGF54_002496 [Candida jiufengensis]
MIPNPRSLTKIWFSHRISNLVQTRFKTIVKKPTTNFNTIIIEEHPKKTTILDERRISKLVNRLKNEKYDINGEFRAILVTSEGKILQIKSFDSETLEDTKAVPTKVKTVQEELPKPEEEINHIQSKPETLKPKTGIDPQNIFVRTKSGKLNKSLRYQRRLYEIPNTAYVKKQEIESQISNSNHKGFKFLNYDKLIKVGAGNYEFTNNKNAIEVKLRIQKSVSTTKIPPIKLTRPETLNFENSTNMLALEQIGKSLIDEFFLKWNFTQYYKFIVTIWKFDQFVKRSLKFIKIENKEMFQIFGLHPDKIFIALCYLEDQDYYKVIENITSKFRETFNPPIKPIYNSQILNEKYLNTLDRYLQEQHIPIKSHIFSQVFQPQLLPTFEIKLPSIPKLKNQCFYKYFQLALVAPYSETTITYKDLHFLTQNLDSMGDVILKRYTAEFMIHHSKINPNFRWTMEDIHFLNSNILFNRLSLAYKLHQGLDNEKHERIMTNRITTTNLNIANEYLGDIFERIVGILYLDDYENCRQWIFKVLNTILQNLIVSQDGIEFIDKEKYVKLYQYHLKNYTMY